MLNRFTDKAKQVMGFARHEVQRLQNEYIGTEHILLGLLRQSDCIGVQVLKEMKIDIERLRVETGARCKTGSAINIGQVPFTPRSKKVFEFAMLEADRMGDKHIGTEHLLLGMVRERDGIAGDVLSGSGVELERAREKTSALRGGSSMKPLKVFIPAQLKELIGKTICFTGCLSQDTKGWIRESDQIVFAATVLACAKYPDGGITIRIASPLIYGQYSHLSIPKEGDKLVIHDAGGRDPIEGKLLSIS